MMYDYEPLSDKEMAEMLNFELVPGKVKFRILTVEDTKSGNGNPMIAMRLKCINTEEPNIGKNGLVNHNLVFTPPAQGFVAAFFRCIGMVEAYKNKQWDSESLIDKEGEGIVGEEEYIKKNGSKSKSFKLTTLFGTKTHTNEDVFAEDSNNKAAKDFFGG